MNISRVLGISACSVEQRIGIWDKLYRLAFIPPVNTPHITRNHIIPSITWTLDGNMDSTPLWVLFSTYETRANVEVVGGGQWNNFHGWVYHRWISHGQEEA